MSKKLMIFMLAFLLFPVVSSTALIQTELSYNPRNAKGIYPFVSYLGDVGQINLVNGNLVFGRSLVGRPGRAGFDLNLGITYNSKIWDHSTTSDYMVVAEPGSWVGLGWRMEFPKLVQGSSSYAVVAGDGSSHEIQDYGSGVWKSVDSTYMLLDPATKTATLKGGVKLIFGNTVGNTSYLTEMKDRNGNQIFVTYVSGTGKISTITDTLGLAANFYYNTDETLEHIEPRGTMRSPIYFSYTAASGLSPSFTHPWQAPSNEKLLSAITIRLNYGFKELTQSFQYNNYGEMTTVTNSVIEYGYPGGQWGVIRRSDNQVFYYSYSTQSFYDPTYGSIEERLVTLARKTIGYNNGGSPTQYNWTFSYQVDQYKSNPLSVTVQDYYGTSVYSLSYTSNGRTWSDGLLYQHERKTAGGSVLRTYVTAWERDDGPSTYLVNPRVWRQTMTEGSLQTRIDFTYTGDGTGNIRQVAQYGYGSSLLRTTTTTYWHESNSGYAALNLTDLVASVSTADGNGTEVARTEARYDESGLTSYSSVPNHDTAYGASFFTRGNATTVQRRYIEGSRSISTIAAYDIAGNSVSATDAKSNITLMVWEPQRNYAFLKTVTNPLGHVTEYAWWQYSGWFNGDLQWVKDPNGVTVSQLTYDTLGRKTQDITATGETKSFSYDDVAYLSTSYSASGYGYRTSSTTGGTTQTQNSDPAGPNVVQSEFFDGWGQITSVSAVYRDGSPGPTTGYTYDTLHRPVTITPMTGGQVSHAYTGNEVTITDPENKRKKYTYNEDGRITKVTEEDASGNLTVETTYQYNTVGKLTGITQGVQTRSFVYDSLGRLTSESHPESRAGGVSYTYTYDDNGNMLTKTDARNVTVTMVYDALNRMTSRTFSDGTANHTFSYDQTSSSLIGLITNGKGRETSAWTSDGIGYSWTYEDAGRPTQQVASIDGAPYSVGYTYSDGGCGCGKRDLVSMSYSTGVSYGRDSIGRIKTITSGGYQYVQDAAYEAPNGALSRLTWADGRKDLFSYDMYGRTTGTSINVTNTIPARYDHAWSLGYGLGGGVTRVDESWADAVYTYSFVNTYTYDRQYRLVSGAGSDNPSNPGTAWSQSWTYDPYGNMLSSNRSDTEGSETTYMNVSYSVNANTNRLTSSWDYFHGTRNYTFDNGGHLTNNSVLTYNYNAQNLLKEARRNSDNVQVGAYRYDAMGRRVKKTWNNGASTGSTIYIHGAMGELLSEYYNRQDNVIFKAGTLSYVMMGDRAVGTRNVGSWWVQGGGEPTEFDDKGPIHRDPLGETQATYRQPFSSSGWNQFSGTQDDPESGLHYNLARNYNAYLSRWMSADSVTNQIYDPQSLNKYAYVRNDPVNLVDPSGKNICINVFNDPICFDDPFSPAARGWGVDIFVYVRLAISMWEWLTDNDASSNGNLTYAPEQHCSISLYGRPTPWSSSPFDHTYIYATTTYSDGSAPLHTIIEGGPIPPDSPVGALRGYVGNDSQEPGQFEGLLPDTNPAFPGNNQIVPSYTGPTTCEDILRMTNTVLQYNGQAALGNGAPYVGAPMPYSGIYNSNSLTYTLLFNVGLAYYFSDFLTNPTPGWGPGFVVPGLLMK